MDDEYYPTGTEVLLEPSSDWIQIGDSNSTYGKDLSIVFDPSELGDLFIIIYHYLFIFYLLLLNLLKILRNKIN